MDANIPQIFTNKADASVTVHRYIVRMPGGTFTYNTDKTVTDDTDFYPDGSSYIEATDVMALSDGTTWSKHYNGGLYGRIKDCTLHLSLLLLLHQINTMQSITSEKPARRQEFSWSTATTRRPQVVHSTVPSSAVQTVRARIFMIFTTTTVSISLEHTFQ